MGLADETPKDDVPVRVCRKCSTQSQTAGEFCPHCGARYSRKSRSRRARVLTWAMPLVLVIAVAATAVALIVHHNNQVVAHNRAVAARKRASALAAAKSRATQLRQRPLRPSAERNG
jgi:uncharacterized paraquat-inducible protein A